MQFSKCDFLTVINCFTIIYCFRFFNLKILPVTEVMTSWKTQSRGRPASPFVSRKWANGKLENVTGGSRDDSSSRGVIKTQEVVAKTGWGVQTFQRWSPHSHPSWQVYLPFPIWVGTVDINPGLCPRWCLVVWAERRQKCHASGRSPDLHATWMYRCPL